MAVHSIFIGYRREDTADVSGRVYDRLCLAFGENAIFKDVYNLGPGVEFGEYILGVLTKCRVFLALIGPTWEDLRNETGKRRLDDPKDWVRIELETALATPSLQVIPVLVNGASMPRENQLPERLRKLPTLNAALVRGDPDFHKDMDNLIRGLEAGVFEVEAPQDALVGAAAWKLIADSLDVNDYIDIQRYCPGTPEVISAGRQKRQLEAWARVAKDDPAAIAALLQAGAFPALERVARETMQRAEETIKRTFERALEESHAREAAEAEARLEARKRNAQRLKPGLVWRDTIAGLPTSACPEMVTMPSGTFVMGGSFDEERPGATPFWLPTDDTPQHEVRIGYTFAIGKFQVTGLEWEAALNSGVALNMVEDIPQESDHPVREVSWEQAIAYITWLNEKLGLVDCLDCYRLPSEAEWEYACRAGTMTQFYFGATISTAQANFNGNHTTPVGAFPANAYGLHDMHGNVWEWCEDCYNEGYVGAPADGAAWLTGDCTWRIQRGGSYYDEPSKLRSANRNPDEIWSDDANIGFRLARTLSR